MDSLVKGLLVVGLLSLDSVSFAACALASSSTSAEFCESFKSAAECHCVFSGLPKGRCTNMNLVYKTMVDMLGPLQRACASQRYTTTQECVDDWNCYRYGGLTSDGQLCSGTGYACD